MGVDVDVRALRAKLDKRIDQVEGWLHPDEAWALHEAVRNFRPDQPAIAVVEIGSWKGRSTIALALGSRARDVKGATKVFAIDPHTGTADGPETGPVSTVAEFRRNVAAAGVESTIELLLATSHEARPRFGPQSVDILFIDGSHDYDDVKADILDWQTTLKDVSLVAFNDPSMPGIYRALRELVLRTKSPYRRSTLVQNTLFFEFLRTKPWTRQDGITLVKLRAVLELRVTGNRVAQYMPRWLVRIGRYVFRGIVSRTMAPPGHRSAGP